VVKLKTLLRKPRFAFVYVLAIWLFLAAHTTARALWIGALIILLGEAVRLWANGYVGHLKVNQSDRARGGKKIGRLITGGPYRYVRHPLYFGTFLIGLGVCVIVGNIWFALAALAGFLWLYRRKMTEEETLIREEVGPDFTRYQQRVPRWFPLGTRYDQPTGQWTWQGIAASQEWKTCIWVSVIVIVLYLRKEWWQEHLLFPRDRWVAQSLLAGLAVLLVAVDGAIELLKYRARRQTRLETG